VTIGISLSTSPSILSSSSTEPFYIVVTARILSTPHPDRPVTLKTHLSPLHGLRVRAFDDIMCTTNPSKKIGIYAANWPHYVDDCEDLRFWGYEFVEIPPLGKGSYSVQHELPRDKIEAAGIEEGESYRLHLNNRCLGTRWWTFASLEELEGVRLRAWRESEMNTEEKTRAYLEGCGVSWESALEKYGDGPTTIRERPDMLAMVPEGDVDFEVS
jgi:hypothetical protein